jgi:hypothetical protein
MLEVYKTMNDESAQENARIVNSEFQIIHEVKQIKQQKNVLQEGITLKNRQLLLSLFALLVSHPGCWHHRISVCTNKKGHENHVPDDVELANNAVISTGSLNSDTVSDDSGENTVEERISLSNLYTETLRRIERDKLYLNPTIFTARAG